MIGREHYIDLIRQVFNYDPATGQVTTNPLPEEWFKTKKSWATWNALHSKKNITRTNGKGYVIARVLGKTFTMHRVAWAKEHGDWPDCDIDHINGDKTDNRICNLRAVSRVENNRNKTLYSNTTSGVCGVSWVASRRLWVASIKINGKSITIKSSRNKDTAVHARKAAEIKYGFHENHGRPA